ncbi:hypothetical protein JYA63_07065 [Fictibacillus nanhaiensis]|uniref:DUF1643 domain-containing protein n=1 Tax=Fictibacillus nanhaiensis TaxID=742169 RepID=A0ABS2ZRI1_9BACL|nr:hypothetical protein [Fictibacillus nanhaiensis]
MNPRGYAQFKVKDSGTFRTDTYLQYGDDKKSIGSCILLNPGSAVLENEVTNEVKLDDTMRQLNRILQEIYEGETISGRFHIYNLFPLQQSSSRLAIDEMENLFNRGKLSLNECLIGSESLADHPWILIGWSVAEGAGWKNLADIRRHWMIAIEKSGVPYFGLKKRALTYYHPCPRLHEKRLQIVQTYKELYKEKLG